MEVGVLGRGETALGVEGGADVDRSTRSLPG